MKKTHFLLILGLSSAGLLFGFVARRLTQVTTAPLPLEMKSTSASKSLPTAVSKSDKSPTILAPLSPSTDTVEILLALDDATLYPRLAAWLLGAGEQDIAAYWDGYRAVKNRKTNIAELVFINWTRLNPSVAIAAVAESKDDDLPWWAWAAHDPQAALAAAISSAPKMVGAVARGIGGFHPDWLRAHLDQIPEASRERAFSSFKELADTEHPLETLKFMQKNALGFSREIFKNLAQKDPWEALEWLKQNPSLQMDRYRSNGNPLDVLMERMIRDYPDDLKRMLAQTPSGEMKRKMEAAMFENLLMTDLAAAIAQAKVTDSAIIAAERFAKIGLNLVKTDPEQAFEMAQQLFVINPSGGGLSMTLEYPNGEGSWGGGEDIDGELIHALIAKDPARLMQMVIEKGKNKSGDYGFSAAAYQWANQDIVSYTTWVNQQTDTVIRDAAVDPVISELRSLGQFNEAIEWARSSKKAEGRQLAILFYQWGTADIAAAASWLEASDLPKEKKVQLQETIKKISSPNDP